MQQGALAGIKADEIIQSFDYEKEKEKYFSIRDKWRGKTGKSKSITWKGKRIHELNEKARSKEVNHYEWTGFGSIFRYAQNEKIKE